MRASSSRCVPVALAGWLSAACCPQAGAQAAASTTAVSAYEEETRARAAETASAEIEPAPAEDGVDLGLVSGRDIASLAPTGCYDLLSRIGVRYEALEQEDAERVAMPVRIDGPIGGVEIATRSGSGLDNVLDCRLAVALAAWAPHLRSAGVQRLEHFSTYRPGARVNGSRKLSGHARALALDAARFSLADGRVLDVERDWDDRERGGEVCPVREDEAEAGRVLRSLVCGAVDDGLFQVVITPHHDRDHANHVHLEVVPGVDWSYVH